MKNFDFYNPVKILFGEGKMAQLPMEIPSNAVILMTYGGGSIKKNGVYDKVKQSLNGYKLLEFGGIEANPKYETLMRAVELARAEQAAALRPSHEEAVARVVARDGDRGVAHVGAGLHGTGRLWFRGIGTVTGSRTVGQLFVRRRL